MRVAPKPLDPDEVMELDLSCRRLKERNTSQAKLSLKFIAA
jgi:hypothetical protein